MRLVNSQMGFAVPHIDVIFVNKYFNSGERSNGGIVIKS